MYARATRGVGKGGGGWERCRRYERFSDVCDTVCDVSTVLVISAMVFNGRGTQYNVRLFYVTTVSMSMA